MTDRHQGYIVTLTDDFREDDAEAIINAIRMVKGVASVTPIVADYEAHMARARVRSQVADLIRDVVRKIDDL